MAIMVFPFLSAAAFGILTICVAATVFGLPVEPTAPLAFLVAALGAIAFAPFVLAAAASVLAVKQAGVGAGFAVTLISLVSGFFFPTHLLPGALQWMADVQPFTPTLELMRHLVSGTALTDPVGLILLKLCLFAAVLLPAGIWLLRRGIEFSRRRGTIIEY
jgi:ABC-2 type transport system permease protein